MVLKRRNFPEVGELVVAQVERIEKTYIYVRLEDYTGLGIEEPDNPGSYRAQGMVHISELANRWIRNISNFAKVNQRLVLKVLRVDENKGHIDLSLRRVTAEQKTSKMNEWKYESRVENLLKIFCEQHGMELREIYEKVCWPLIDKYGDIHTAFDKIKEEGIEVLNFLNIDEDLKKDFFTLIDTNIQLQRIFIEGQFEIVVYCENGIEIIKDALLSALSIPKEKYVEFKIHYIGAPYYPIKIIAKDFPSAEKYLKKIKEIIFKKIESKGGNVAFERTDF
ncbi:MAG: S1 RNA-binding domain-containing protein [Promethearchaeota archaeon]